MRYRRLSTADQGNAAREKQRLLDLMDEAANRISAEFPEGQAGLSFGQETVAALFFGCMGLYRAVFLLLQEYLTIEAEILMRTMFFDSATLVLFQGQADRLEQWATRLVYRSLRYEMRLYAEQERFGIQAAKANMQTASKEMNRLLKQAKDLGLSEEEAKSFPSPEGMLRLMSQESAGFLISRAHHAVHTSRLSLSSRVRSLSEDRAEFRSKGSNQEVLRIGAPSLDMFLASAGAIAALLQWESVERMKAIREDVTPRLAEILGAARP